MLEAGHAVVSDLPTSVVLEEVEELEEVAAPRQRAGFIGGARGSTEHNFFRNNKSGKVKAALKESSEEEQPESLSATVHDLNDRAHLK